MNNYKINNEIVKILTILGNNKEEEDFLVYLKKYSENNDMTNKYNKKLTQDISTDFDINHNIFYNKTSKIYYNYIGDNYVLMNEDNIIYLVLEYINIKMTTTDVIYKQNLKSTLIKKIKDNNIYESIPDTNTIQNILNYLNHTLFTSKAYCKIFLIIIGNIITKKKTENKIIVFTRTNLKSFLIELNQIISIYFCNVNLFNYFKFKYTLDHESSDHFRCILPCNRINCDIMKKDTQFFINLIVVSIYYSNRYENINQYIETENLYSSLKDTIYYFEKTKDDIIIDFVKSYIIEEKEQKISQKDLIFLWKKYLYENDMFVNIFTSYNDFIYNIFHYTNNPYTIESNNNILYGFYSMEFPQIDFFKKFWNSHFSYDDNESHFEINEILYLYNKNTPENKNNLTEPIIKLIIQNFYSNFEISENKYIHKLKCELWDKKKEIQHFVTEQNINLNDNFNIIYKKYISTKNEYRISKIYFQKYYK
tara:strand:- start:14701 stop:16137 length:1437 start_codon:yes stop_codon:yes gene_type:complete